MIPCGSIATWSPSPVAGTPTVHLYSQSRSLLEYDDELATFVPGKAKQACQCIGAAAGVFPLPALLRDAVQKVTDALAALNIKRGDVMPIPDCEHAPDYHIEALWRVDVSPKPRR